MKKLFLLALVACFAFAAHAQQWGPQSKVVTDTIYSEIEQGGDRHHLQ